MLWLVRYVYETLRDLISVRIVGEAKTSEYNMTERICTVLSPPRFEKLTRRFAVLASCIRAWVWDHEQCRQVIDSLSLARFSLIKRYFVLTFDPWDWVLLHFHCVDVCKRSNSLSIPRSPEMKKSSRTSKFYDQVSLTPVLGRNVVMLANVARSTISLNLQQ